MGKLTKRSHGVGKYLKYHKEKVTGESMEDIGLEEYFDENETKELPQTKQRENDK